MMVISKISLSLFLLSIIIPCVFKLSRRQNGRKDFFFSKTFTGCFQTGDWECTY